MMMARAVVMAIVVCCHGIMTSAKMPDRRAIVNAQERLGYSFENATDMDHVIGRNVSTSRRHAKYGDTSLRWAWSAGDAITIDMRSQLGGPIRACGVAFWVYREFRIEASLIVVLMNGFRVVETRRMRMDFIGWRAMYISYRSFKPASTRRITRLRFQAPRHVVAPVDAFYFDIVRLARSCNGWSYDRFNLPSNRDASGGVNALGTFTDLDGHYTSGHHWQQAYRWSEYEKVLGQSPPNDDAPLTVGEQQELNQLQRIDRRLEAWFLVPDDLLFSKSEMPFLRYLSLHCNMTIRDTVVDPGRNIVKKRVGKTLSRRIHSSLSLDQPICIDNAKKLVASLYNSQGELTQLFSSRDIFPSVLPGPPGYGVRKFNDVIYSVLFPLALDHYLTKRIMRKTNSDRKKRTKKRMRWPDSLVSGRPKMGNKIQGIRQEKIVDQRNTTDGNRLGQIFQLLDHLHLQGFSEGSACGVMDHFMNLNALYFHSMYLLRKELQASGRLDRELRTMMWYSEIGEIRREKHSDVTGTTADRLKNFEFNRLLLVMMMPSRTNTEKRQRLRMARQFKEWLDVALTKEQGFAGVIKPDYVGFHHRGPYLTAYVPGALHTASLLHYLTHNTSFALSAPSLDNLRNALKLIFLASSDYSVPAAVAGRFMSYTNNALISLAPAFAYASVGSLPGLDDFHVETSLIFLRLFKPKDPVVQGYLMAGDLASAQNYHNTLGSLALLVRIRRVLQQRNYHSTYHPEGHWVANYAALSIHRRDSWTATAKGCSAYVWDYEATQDQNPYGRFTSQGNLQISNGRRSLVSHDVFNGWNWKAIPGTTVIDLPMDELKFIRFNRNFARSTFAGGVRVTGRRGVANGLFGMDFIQPMYQDDARGTKQPQLRFKKSFLFIEDLIICLGSNIEERSVINGNRVITTLFQNRIFRDSFIAVDRYKFPWGNERNLSLTLDDNKPHFLLDSNNNGYYIPRSRHLQVTMRRPTEVHRPDGKIRPGGKMYATANFDHGQSPVDASYEYAILVNSGLKIIKSFRRAQNNPFERFYSVLRSDEVAHVIKVVTVDERVFYSYVIFDARKFVRRDGPLMRVSQPCLVLIEQSQGNDVFVGVSDPDLRLSPLEMRSSGATLDKGKRAKSIPRQIILRFNYREIELTRTRNTDLDLQLSVQLLPDQMGRKRLLRMVLAKGLTTEVTLTRLATAQTESRNRRIFH